MTGKGGGHWHCDQSEMPVIALFAITISTIEWQAKACRHFVANKSRQSG